MQFFQLPAKIGMLQINFWFVGSIKFIQNSAMDNRLIINLFLRLEYISIIAKNSFI